MNNKMSDAVDKLCALFEFGEAEAMFPVEFMNHVVEEIQTLRARLAWYQENTPQIAAEAIAEYKPLCRIQKQGGMMITLSEPKPLITVVIESIIRDALAGKEGG